MFFLDTIRARVGDVRPMEKVAEKEVALAMQMPLMDEYHQKK